MAFEEKQTTRAVFDRTCRSMVAGVLDGVNGTVFAYGATGSGKTHTMVGVPSDPGAPCPALGLQSMFLAGAEMLDDPERADSLLCVVNCLNALLCTLARLLAS